MKALNFRTCLQIFNKTLIEIEMNKGEHNWIDRRQFARCAIKLKTRTWKCIEDFVLERCENWPVVCVIWSIILQNWRWFIRLFFCCFNGTMDEINREEKSNSSTHNFHRHHHMRFRIVTNLCSYNFNVSLFEQAPTEKKLIRKWYEKEAMILIYFHLYIELKCVCVFVFFLQFSIRSVRCK